jgi:DNA gyrase/topoisomerase IV subunit B
MDKASEAILALKPVTFHYKTDSKSTAQFGLIAEDVAEVNRDLVVRDKDGKPYTVRYDQVNAMLLNEFLKEHKKVEAQSHKIEEQETTIVQLKKDFQVTSAQQQKEIQFLSAQLREQAAQIQKVSAQIELNRPAPQQVVLKTP